MEMEFLMEKRAALPHMMEISTEKRVATPHLMMAMAMMIAMAKVMEFDEVGGRERAPIGCHIVDLAAWLGSGTLKRPMPICAT